MCVCVCVQRVFVKSTCTQTDTNTHVAPLSFFLLQSHTRSFIHSFTRTHTLALTCSNNNFLWKNTQLSLGQIETNWDWNQHTPNIFAVFIYSNCKMIHRIKLHLFDRNVKVFFDYFYRMLSFHSSVNMYLFYRYIEREMSVYIWSSHSDSHLTQPKRIR